jgi:UDP-N-acetylmuramoylalanine--D-glutamate ligase
MTQQSRTISGTLLAGQRATIVGLGREGRDLARFLSGAGASVLVTDARSAEALSDDVRALEPFGPRFSLGGHPLELLDETDVVYVSPGVPPEIPFLEEAHRRGIRVSSATELFFSLCPARIVGITGSSGKSTTTAMTGKVLQSAGLDAVVGGNIGVPMLGMLERISSDSLAVMELSSFQLEFMRQSPWIATVTNVTPNHLDRHPSMDAYREAKGQILAHQSPTDWCVLNHDDVQSQLLPSLSRKLEFSQREAVTGAYRDGQVLVRNLGSGVEAVCDRQAIRLRGDHNVANALTVIATTSAVGVAADRIRQGIESFRALPHRLEPVGAINGATYYNDSIATSPERSIAALLSFSEPVVLLAGGRDKHLPMGTWAELIRERAHTLVLFGEAASLIAEAAREAGVGDDAIVVVQTLEQAVDAAVQASRPGDAVLLSPGCTSYDAFFDFEARGDRFRELVALIARERA